MTVLTLFLAERRGIAIDIEVDRSHSARRRRPSAPDEEGFHIRIHDSAEDRGPAVRATTITILSAEIATRLPRRLVRHGADDRGALMRRARWRLSEPPIVDR